jgi:hypothetical protein
MYDNMKDTDDKLHRGKPGPEPAAGSDKPLPDPDPRPEDRQALEDKQRLAFLRQLDEAFSHVNVTDWEAEFIESQLSRSLPGFTSKQRQAVDKLIHKYGDMIGW